MRRNRSMCINMTRKYAIMPFMTKTVLAISVNREGIKIVTGGKTTFFGFPRVGPAGRRDAERHPLLSAVNGSSALDLR